MPETMYVESGGTIYTRDDFAKAQKIYEALQKRLNKSIAKEAAIDVECYITDVTPKTRAKQQKAPVPVPEKLRDYESIKVKDQIHYYHYRDSTKKVAFRDLGSTIALGKGCSDDDLLAALQLADKKFTGFVVHGSDEYKARCAILCANHGLKLKNPELQEIIEKQHQINVKNFKDVWQPSDDLTKNNTYGEYDDSADNSQYHPSYETPKMR